MKKVLVFILVCFMFVACNITKIEPNVEFIKIEPKSTGVYCEIKNKSKNDVLEIVWDKSTINGSHCFLRGKYIDAGKSQLNEIIAPEETMNITIYPSENVEYKENFKIWDINKIVYPVKLVLCFKIGNKEEFIIKEIFE